MLAKARPAPKKPVTPLGELPRSLRDVLQALITARAEGRMCTRLALQNATRTRNKQAVYQYVHRLRQDHNWDIRTVPCVDGDASTGGYHLDTWPEAMKGTSQVGFDVL